MSEARVDIVGRPEPLFVRINGPNAGFQLQTDVIRAKARAELAPLDIDLLEIASVIFFADSAVRRGGPTRPGMGEGWRRTFRFTIPVHEPAIWTRPDVREALVDAVEFLTEDRVEFEFVSRPPELPRDPFLSLDPSSGSFAAEDVILFSGGLDSFAGALETLSTTDRNVILLTHRSAQKAISRQVRLGAFLAERFRNRVLHINVLARRKQQEASDSSQRSRSFLFAALGKVIANTFGARRIGFYENGIISHNLPISKQVVGTMATRTTHPLSLLRLDRLMELLDPKRHVPIANQYRWLTKRDVLERIAQNGGQSQIGQTVSCTSIREQNTLHTHCGTCSQCLDRRFAILAAGLEAFDHADDYATDVLFGAREATRSATMAIEWTRHALSLAQIDGRDFLDRFGLEFGRISQGHPEMSLPDTLEQTRSMHARHGTNVEQVLRRVLDEKSADIIHRRLPATSLVVRTLSEQTSEGAKGLLTDPRQGTFEAPPVPPGEEVDIVPDPDAPLQVRFEGSFEMPVVSIVGLCRLSGMPATIPTALKDDYCQDRLEGRALDEHRHVTSGELARRLGIQKEAVRQRIQRCRHTLESSFHELHQLKPGRDLLLQNRKGRGFRLDPEIILLGKTDSPGGKREP